MRAYRRLCPIRRRRTLSLSQLGSPAPVSCDLPDLQHQRTEAVTHLPRETSIPDGPSRSGVLDHLVVCRRDYSEVG